MVSAQASISWAIPFFISRQPCSYFTFINLMNSSMAFSSPGNCFFRLSAISVFPAWMWYSLRMNGTVGPEMEMTTTLLPALDKSAAAVKPPTPLPITTASRAGGTRRSSLCRVSVTRGPGGLRHFSVNTVYRCPAIRKKRTTATSSTQLTTPRGHHHMAEQSRAQRTEEEEH
ncbi:hypothetical protein EYF80_018922 [Liparis tanakae]|uniref:Uncharacterized protein n=1 Tax=Liparis tanakae TaxID=230148 RepID=A0A4Z2HYQ3_9TELE|nr:hypothetical protein EYF80_018922 [Liparis tanakae]